MLKQEIGVPEFSRLFPGQEEAARWLYQARWPDVLTCPFCGEQALKKVGRRYSSGRPFQCFYTSRACTKSFGVRTGSFLEGHSVGFQQWVMAFYMLADEGGFRRDIEVELEGWAARALDSIREAYWGESRRGFQRTPLIATRAPLSEIIALPLRGTPQEIAGAAFQ